MDRAAIQAYKEYLRNTAAPVVVPGAVTVAKLPDLPVYRERFDAARRHGGDAASFSRLPEFRKALLPAQLQADVATGRRWLAEAQAWGTYRGGRAGYNLILALRGLEPHVNSAAASLEVGLPEPDQWQNCFAACRSTLEQVRFLSYRPMPTKR